MDKKYTVNELAELLQLSHTAIRKRIKRGDLRNVEERLNGRLTTFAILSNEELNDLLKEIGNIKKASSTFNEPEETQQIFNKQPVNQIDQQELVFRVMEYSEKFNERLENYVSRLINAESQVKLLEDSEGRTKQEFIELQAEVKRLTNLNNLLSEENKKLREELEKKNKKWWIIKK